MDSRSLILLSLVVLSLLPLICAGDDHVAANKDGKHDDEDYLRIYWNHHHASGTADKKHKEDEKEPEKHKKDGKKGTEHKKGDFKKKLEAHHDEYKKKVEEHKKKYKKKVEEHKDEYKKKVEEHKDEYKKKVEEHKRHFHDGDVEGHDHKHSPSPSHDDNNHPSAPTGDHNHPGAPSDGAQACYQGQCVPAFKPSDFGAKGDGNSDDTGAVLAAFGAACKAASGSGQRQALWIPAGTRNLVGYNTVLQGPCGPGVTIQMDGQVVAPAQPATFANGRPLAVLQVAGINGANVVGTGGMQGQGNGWWRMQLQGMLSGRQRPVLLLIIKSDNALVSGIRLENSPMVHLKVLYSNNVHITGVSTYSPHDSPNTDGLQTALSSNVLIENCNLQGGDDNISMLDGSRGITIRNVVATSGHGISIGSLGQDGSNGCVSNIDISDSKLQNTMYGLRIKTYQGGTGSVQDVSYRNVELDGVDQPIIIDQYYCNGRNGLACGTSSRNVAVRNIKYQDIRGSASGGGPKQGILFRCSDTVPCCGITLNNVQIGNANAPYVMNAYGSVLSNLLPLFKNSFANGCSSGANSANGGMAAHCSS